MTLREFLGRWGGYLALVIAFAIGCSLLSWWQWARRAEVAEQARLITTNYSAAAVPIDELLPTRTAFRADEEWRSVAVTGEYLRDEQLLVRNRPLDGSPGFEVLVPFRIAEPTSAAGRILIVDRGWIGLGNTSDVPANIPEAPSGVVRLSAHLRPSEPAFVGRTAPKGQVPSIDLAEVAKQVPGELYTRVYVLLGTEQPSQAVLPVAVSPPAPDSGVNLSYALQWIAFGLLAFIGLIWAVRHDRSVARGEAPRRPKRPTDADEEDALLDSGVEVRSSGVPR